MKLPESPLQSVRSAAWVSGLLAVLVYANTLTNDFAYDDLHIVVENPTVQSLEALPGAILSSWWPEENGEVLGLWRPTSTAILGVEWALWGKEPILFHLVNIVGHGITSALVVLLLVELTTLPVALTSGVIFALHPVHTEAVANVIGIAEIASTLFFLLACLVHLRGASRPWRSALIVAALYALAFGAKEIAVTLPGVIFLMDASKERLGFGDLLGYLRDKWRTYAGILVVAGAMLAERFHILGSIANPLGPLGADLLEQGVPRIWTLGEIWSHYFRLMVFPLDLLADYSPNVIPIGLGWHALNTAGVVLILATLVGSLLAWRRPALGPGSPSARVVAFGVLWFLITISPVSNVLFLAGVLLAERTLYLPSIGAIAGMAWLAVRFYRRRRVAGLALMVTATCFMTWRTWTRNPVWRDNLTVFGRMLEDTPYSGRSQWVLGDLFLQRGRTSEALVSYRAALGLLGDHYFLTTQIARKLISVDMNDAAERLLLRSMESHPEFVVAPHLLGIIASERGDAVETERYMRIALDIQPSDRVSQHLLAWALTEQGRYGEAIVARRAAIDLGEGDYWQQWVSLAELEAFNGDTVAARVALDSARVKAASAGGIRQVNERYQSLLGFPPPPGLPGEPTDSLGG